MDTSNNKKVGIAVFVRISWSLRQ